MPDYKKVFLDTASFIYYIEGRVTTTRKFRL